MRCLPAQLRVFSIKSFVFGDLTRVSPKCVLNPSLYDPLFYYLTLCTSLAYIGAPRDDCVRALYSRLPESSLFQRIFCCDCFLGLIILPAPCHKHERGGGGGSRDLNPFLAFLGSPSMLEICLDLLQLLSMSPSTQHCVLIACFCCVKRCKTFRREKKMISRGTVLCTWSPCVPVVLPHLHSTPIVVLHLPSEMLHVL